MRVGSGENTYGWIDNWAKIPESESSRMGWAHPGIVVTESGNVITCHPGDPNVMTFDSDGNLLSTWQGEFADAHGITIVNEGGTEYLWIADNGSKRSHRHDYGYPPGADDASGQVFKTTLDGQTVMTLDTPPHSAYETARYSPTTVAVNEERFGGNGDIWVGDGYGASYVHRFTSDGEYVSSINGEEGAGRYNCPHGIFIDRRKSEAELYVADRANARVQVYDMEGGFKRSFGDDFLTTPSAFVTYGDLLVIAELRARLAITDMDDNLVVYLGDNEQVCEVDGWPNNAGESGEIIPTSLLEAGKFNSPHGLTADAEGNLYVAEWLIGGRVIKLAKS
jgi:sugar lactone lactonase YvrE